MSDNLNKSIEAKIMDDSKLEQIIGGTIRPHDHPGKRDNSKKAAPLLETCPQCGEPKLSHRACTNCGYKKG